MVLPEVLRNTLEKVEQRIEYIEEKYVETEISINNHIDSAIRQLEIKRLELLESLKHDRQRFCNVLNKQQQLLEQETDRASKSCTADCVWQRSRLSEGAIILGAVVLQDQGIGVQAQANADGAKSSN
jgi:hypothetical protein